MDFFTRNWLNAMLLEAEEENGEFRLRHPGTGQFLWFTATLEGDHLLIQEEGADEPRRIPLEIWEHPAPTDTKDLTDAHFVAALQAELRGFRQQHADHLPRFLDLD
jgi:hypothetical protein